MTSPFVSRAEWGAAPRRSSTALSASAVTIHWAGTPSNVGGHEDCARTVRSFQSYHMNTQGWADIAYNMLVCPHGYIFEGRGGGRRSAANGSNAGNSASYAICYIMGTGQAFTDEAKRAIVDAAAILVPEGGDWWSHRDWLNTGCPGDEIAEWVNAGHPVDVVPEPEPEPEPAPVPCEQKTFGRGDSDRCVIYIQRLLNRRGYGLVDDGDFGPNTEAAVRRFQSIKRLTADGVVGPKTWPHLWWGQTL